MRKIFKRDQGVCALCHAKTGNWEADHILEWAEGGKTELENLQTLCVPCHKRKTAEYAARRSKKVIQHPDLFETPQ